MLTLIFVGSHLVLHAGGYLAVLRYMQPMSDRVWWTRAVVYAAMFCAFILYHVSAQNNPGTLPRRGIVASPEIAQQERERWLRNMVCGAWCITLRAQWAAMTLALCVVCISSSTVAWCLVARSHLCATLAR